MHSFRLITLTLAAAAALAALAAGGCQRQKFNVDDELLAAYRTRIGQSTPARGVDPASPAVVRRRPMDGVATTRPDGMGGTGGAGSGGSLGVDAMAPRNPGRVVELKLMDCLHRALANSLDIKVESFSTGISAADIVAAQAAFDAVIFLDYTWSKLDTPQNSTFFPGGDQETSDFSGGVRKRIATGGEITARYGVDRTWTNQPFRRFNAAYTGSAGLELRHPLLRGFGVDVNRAQIYIARNNRDMSMHAFRRTVIQTLAAAEEAFWNLYFARQSLAIQRALLRQTEETRDLVQARLELDALPSTLKQSESAVATRRAAVIRLAADVKDAEDALKNVLNDPDLPLDQDIAIVPADVPLQQRVPLNASQETWAAMENRSELREARLAIENAAISRGVAKNGLLPRLDVFLQWNVNGLRNSLPNVNHEIGTLDFQDYIVGLSFEFPIGNRAAEAGVRKSQLQLEQAVAAYHNLAADVMTDVQTSLRDVQTSYDEILANRAAVDAAAENLSTLIKRREGLTPEYLDVQLRAQEGLAEARRALQQAIVRYNTAIVGLERAKGTLLTYDRVELQADAGAP